MAHYIEFKTADGGTMLVEVEVQETNPPPGIVKAGIIKDTIKKTVATAELLFEDAIDRVIRQNVDALTKALQNLVKKPDEVEITFGIKGTGELGNFAIGKLSAEANFDIKLTWKRDGSPSNQSKQ
jgi:hypothetical protein